MIKKGDKDAFRKLVEQHQQYAFSLAFRILCNEEDARDTVQDSMIKVWKNIDKYNAKMKFTTWLYKIVTNTAIDKLRKLKHLNHVRLEDSLAVVENLDPHNQQNQLENKDTGQLISLLAEGLPEKQRLVFVLRDIQDLSSAEVVDILDLSETNIKSNLYHARLAIREKLNKIMSYERRVI